MTIPLPLAGPHLLSVALTDHNGAAVTPDAYLGRRALYYFGFTHCRSVCPRALSRTARALELLPEQHRPRLLFVTVDPDRDDATTMARHVAANVPHAVGLTGERNELSRLRAAMHVHARRTDPDDRGDYDTPHSSFTYLFDAEGTYETHFGMAVTAEEMAARLSMPRAAVSTPRQAGR